MYTICYLFEEWRPVVGFEGWYEVSNFGRVRSTDRMVNGKLGSKLRKKGTMLTPSNNGKGYLRVRLSKNGKCRAYRIHQLVAFAFPECMYKPYFEGATEINHRNHKKWDNFVDLFDSKNSNLEWCTRQENIHYSGELVAELAKERMKEIDMLLNGIVVKHFKNADKAAEYVNETYKKIKKPITAYNIRTAINNISKGIQKSQYGYQWSYA